MTVAAGAPRFQNFSGTGNTGPFTFNWRVLLALSGAPYIIVTRIVIATGAQTVLTLGGGADGYTFSPILGGNGGGTITTNTAIALDDERLFVEGATPDGQDIAYRNQGDFFPEAHEKSFDKLTIIAQEASYKNLLSIRFPTTDEVPGETVLPLAPQRARKAIICDEDGNITVSADDYEDQVAAVAASATLASQWASLTTGIVASTDYSAKAWAIGGTGVTNTASRGAAKEWATKTGGTVDGTEYSAKYYALAAGVFAVSAGNSATAAATSETNAATSASQAATAGASGVVYTTGGTSTAYTLTPSPTIAPLVDGVSVTARIHTGNTGNATLNVNGTGAVSISSVRGLSQILPSELGQGNIVRFVYFSSGPQWVIQGSPFKAPELISFNTAGTPNTYTCTPSPAIANLYVGLKVTTRVHAINTGSSTLNVSGLTPAAPWISQDGSAVAAGELPVGANVTSEWDGTNWRVVGMKMRRADIITGNISANVNYQDGTDPTKQFNFVASSITAGQNRAITMPDKATTLVGKDTTDTLTNKTYDTAGTGNSFLINGVAVTANTGTGAVARASSPTFVTPVLGAASATSISFGQTVLNYYGEGTFTPTFFGTGTPGTPTYSAQVGKYTRIGNMCKAISRLNITAIGGIVGSVRVGGQPFTCGNIAAPAVTGEFGSWSALTYVWNSFMQPSTTDLWLYKANAAGGVTAVAHTEMSATTSLWISVTFLI